VEAAAKVLSAEARRAQRQEQAAPVLDRFRAWLNEQADVGGFFVIWWATRRSFTEWEIRLLQGISDLAGIFLENAQL
jgi:hypothetical protein